MMDLTFYKGKKVFITGHTGFKGTWMCHVLHELGADVTGYALTPPTDPSIYKLTGTDTIVHSIVGDIRDGEALKRAMREAAPEIVIHMAAQPIVRDSYKEPVYTYETNVMGTVHVCEAVRATPSVKSFVNVTTDKVYLNRERAEGYREDEELNGFDPYSNSKSCSELVTSAYINSFFTEGPAVSTCRAGNVIGGGDFANDRIIPDCIRAVAAGREIIVRNPHSTRPYQHVLEPVCAYLMLAKAQYEDRTLAGSFNVGPEDDDCYATGELVDLFCKTWETQTGVKPVWKNVSDDGPHEANFLKLDCTKIKKTFQWKPKWNVAKAMEKIVAWSLVHLDGGDVRAVLKEQIKEYLA